MEGKKESMNGYFDLKRYRVPKLPIRLLENDSLRRLLRLEITNHHDEENDRRKIFLYEVEDYDLQIF